MKAALNLPQRPIALYLVAVLDVLVIFIVFFLLVAGTRQESGILIDPPESSFRLPHYDRSVSVTVIGGGMPSIFIGRERVTRESFPVRLEEVSEEISADLVLMRFDKGLSVAVERELIESALGLGLRVALPGKEATSESEGQEGGVPPAPPSAPAPIEP